MAPSFEVSTVQFSKDLRSGGKEFKRARDSLEKWHYGSELKSGVKPVYDDDLRICQAAMPKKQVRPAKKSNRCTCW